MRRWMISCGGKSALGCSQGFGPEYTEGVYQHGETRMIVSRGLGNSIFPLRLNNRPELVIVELVRGESQ